MVNDTVAMLIYPLEISEMFIKAIIL